MNNESQATDNLSEIPIEDILKELERRYTSPELLGRFAIEQKAIQFKREHAEIIKAAIKIHEYCESTEEWRDGLCDKCFLYNPKLDVCGVGWSEKALDENILRLCKEYKDLK